MTTESQSDAESAVEARSGLSHEAIRRQLDRILEHPEFLATNKMRDFLRFVVEETLAGRRSRLKGYTVATQVFDRGPGFDPGQDPIVSIQAGRLRRALERYYLVAGTSDPVHIDIPKGGYVPRFTAQMVPAERRAAGRSGSSERRRSPLRSDPAIAIVPLENLSEDPDQLHLAVGLTEELTTELNRFKDIAVVPCPPQQHSVGLPAAPGELGRVLGVRFILQGTVRRDRESVKVACHLTDARSGRQLWAESYSHPLEASRLIATQEEIARSVVAAVGSEYGIIARRLSAESRKKPPEELDTYEAMLRYYSHQVSPSPESIATCLPALEKASLREPAYGPVWSALATLYCQLYSMDVGDIDQPLAAGLRYARRGVELEPGSQLGRLILAYASYLVEDSVTFEEESETAIGLNPNSPYTVGTVGYFHMMRGEFDLGRSLLERAIEANPCHPSWFHGGFVVEHIHRHEYETALLEVEKHRPHFGFWLPVAFTAILGRLGRTEEAQEHADELRRQKPDFENRAHELFHRTVKIEPVIDDLIEGLRAAGMSIEIE